jgi:hypothetical protein
MRTGEAILEVGKTLTVYVTGGFIVLDALFILASWPRVIGRGSRTVV